ncbi:MAG: TGS domain-containing protein, partial [Rikenellaceae bacterium]|nr:TGS domain-containing protein [Rikenellaceae bacterium]
SMFIEKFNAPIIEKLKESGIDFTIKGRIKSVYSIWKKMQRKTVTIDEIYDLFAIRIVFKPIAFVPEKTQCWNIYSLITDLYKPKPDRIRDWVNIPKANGYEALHCTVMGPDGVWAEVQIRSERMDEIAEKGFAAHWKYKERENREGELDKWIREVQNALNSPTEDAVEFLDEFKLNLYTSEVVVFTPKGESVTMPKGAVVLDFAYEIHSSLGDRAIGAKINHKIESLYTPISNGDQIEIITSATAHPVLESLNHVVTAKAKQKIKTFLKKERENNLSNGMRIFEEEMKKRGVTPSARVFHKLLPAYNSSSKDEFYVKLGAGIISLDNVDKILRENAAIKLVKYWSLQVSNTLKFFGGSSKESDSEPANASDDIKIASCCMPIPGDEVIGFRQDNGEVVVHKKSCDEAIKLAARHGDKIVPIKWSSEK